MKLWFSMKWRRLVVWVGVLFGLALMFLRNITPRGDYPVFVDMRALVQDFQSNQTIRVPLTSPHPFTYIRNPTCCQRKGSNFDCPLLVLLVKSAIGNIDQRLAIRNTWGKENVFKTIRTKTFFLLGDVGDKKEFITFLQLEDKMYKDVIQENFRDTYDNNTIKTIMGFNWVVQSCFSTKYVMFLDDDFIILPKNIESLIHLAEANGGKNIYTGHAMKMGEPIRHRASKWYVSHEEYPYTYYPTYASAGAYVMSIDVVKKFQIAFKYTERFRHDDVYLGIVAQSLGVDIQDHKGFKTDGVNEFSDHETVAIHWFKSYEIYNLWKKYKRKGTIIL